MADAMVMVAIPPRRVVEAPGAGSAPRPKAAHERVRAAALDRPREWPRSAAPRRQGRDAAGATRACSQRARRAHARTVAAATSRRPALGRTAGDARAAAARGDARAAAARGDARAAAAR